MIRGNRLDSIQHMIDTLIAVWNKNDATKLSLCSVKSDTAYVNVKATNAFTRFGTTGTERTLASTVFTLTEDDRYSYVVLKFDETEHASREYIPATISVIYFSFTMKWWSGTKNK